MAQRALAKGSTLPPVIENLMRVYSMRFCPYAQRTRMVLLYKNIEHEVVNVNLWRKPKWFWQRNPLGLVPVLEYKGQIVYESVVCDDFLEDLVPQPALTSKCPFRRARDKLLMVNYDKMIPHMYSLNGQEEKQQQKSRQHVFKTLKMLQQELGTKKFFGGDQLSMVDFHLYPWFERMPAIKQLSGYEVLPAAEFPQLSQWQAAMEALPCVRDTMYPVEWHMEFLVGLAQKQPSYDIGLQDSATAKL